jgi:glutamine synthetase
VHALYAPTVNSYRRTTSGEFSGNGLSWGYDSRMVSCRVLSEGDDTRLEGRVPGADVDPYLAIAALLASARDGLVERVEPVEPLMGEDYARPVPPLPSTLGEAVDRFRGDPFTTDAFGKDVVAHYAEAGGWEWDQFLAPAAVSEWSDAATSTSSDRPSLGRARPRAGRTRPPHRRPRRTATA